MAILWTLFGCLYGNYMGVRNRLTDQAVANVGAAHTALLVKIDGGWQVELCNDNKCINLDNKLGESVVYPAKGAATRTLTRHNARIKVKVKPQL